MFVPFLSKRGEEGGGSSVLRWLERRKGGGGGGRGSRTSSISSSSSGRSSSSKSSGSATSGSGGRSSSRINSSSSSKSKSNVHSSTKSKIWKSSNSWKSTSSNNWVKTVGVASVIPAGYMFAGRIGGGGDRDDVYGTRTYGSGYPGITGRGTSGRGFPFFFWPLSWPLTVGGGTGAGLYLHSNYEYGAPSNTSRPGGPMSYTIFSSASIAPNTPSTFRFLADNATVALMNLEIEAACGTFVDRGNSYTLTPLAETDSIPSPEQAVQYFRASSAVLTLDGYNNSATYAVEGAPDSALPDDTNHGLLSCLNVTIGQTIPLIDGASGLPVASGLNITGLVGLVWMILWAA